MNFQSDFKAERVALQHAAHIASSICQELKDFKRCLPHHPLRDPTIPDLNLPFPHDILAPISSLPIPDRTRHALFQSFHSRVSELQQQYTSAYRHACQETILGSGFDNDLGSVCQAYQAMYQRHCISMVSKPVSFLLEEFAKYQHVLHDPKRPFNNEYTPVLEKYFKYNAYPSAKHQEVLAEKSKMSKRQIEVWFQNHRNRSKKDGTNLKRLTSDLPLQRALSALPERTHFSPDRSATPSDEGYATESMDEDEYPPQPTLRTDPFDGFRPPHAFPTTFTAAKSGPDPFPSNNGVFKFPPPTWMRTPATASPPSVTSSSVDVNELARIFHLKLSFIGAPGKRIPKSKSSTKEPWFAATVTTLPRGRHPAFESFQSSPPSNILTTSFSFQFPMGSGTTSVTNAFLPPHPPPRATSTTPSRKISPLPRRMPTSNLPSTAPSSPRTLSSSSRSSSFSSDISTRSRISSSSSRNSTPEPSTPPPLPSMEITALQDPVLVQQQADVYDFSDIFGADPDELLTSFSSSNFDFSAVNSMNPMLNKTPSPLFDVTSLVSIPSSDYMATQS